MRWADKDHGKENKEGIEAKNSLSLFLGLFLLLLLSSLFSLHTKSILLQLHPWEIF